MINNELQKLIAKIANKQDKSAFNDIFDYFAPKLIGYIVGLGSQREIAEEITQDVLGVVWQKSKQFDFNKGNVSTWIFTIARNKRVDRIRKNENPQYVTGEMIEALYPHTINQSRDSELEVEKIQSKLNINERKLIKMSFFEGKSHNIISRELEIPLGTVKSRIRNLLKKMKKN